MHTSSVLVAAFAAAASLVGAAEAQERPKIYFPRQLKRQYSNITITSNAPSQATASDTTSESTKRDTLSDLFASLSADMPTSTDESIFLGPTADQSTPQSGTTTVVVESTVVVPPSTTPTSAGSVTDPSPASSQFDSSTDTSAALGSTGGIPATVVPPTSSAASASPSETASSTGTSGDATSVETSLVPTNSSGILIAPTGIVSSSSASPSPTASGDLSPLGSALSSVVSQVTSAILPSTNGTDAATATKSEQPAGTASPTASSTPTGSAGVSQSYTEGSSTVPGSSTGPWTTSPPTVTAQSTMASPSNATDSDSSTLTSSGYDVTTTPASTNTGFAYTTSPDGGNTTATETFQSGSTSMTTPLVTTDSDVTAPPTTVPTLTPTVVPIQPNITSTGNTTIAEQTKSSTPTSMAVIATTSGVTSIEATATLSGTETSNWLPTTMVVAAPPSKTATDSAAPTATASGLPATLPKAITPNSDNTTIPDGTTIIGITFLYPLNYDFVANNGLASAQIFNYLPVAVRATGDFDAAKVQMVNLGPLVSTESTLGYIATVAKMTYPTSLIDQLQLQVKTPNSPLYNNPEGIVRNLTAEINPAIDILTFALDGAGSTVSGDGSTSGSDGAGANALNGNGSGEATSKPGQQGTTAGIALGVISVAGAYGAAMFVVARRYKRKKQAHRRASSLTDASDMRSAAGSPHFMGGALLSRDFSSYGGVAGGRNSHGTQGSGRSGANNSARTAIISGPMAAENSLGWN